MLVQCKLIIEKFLIPKRRFSHSPYNANRLRNRETTHDCRSHKTYNWGSLGLSLVRGEPIRGPGFNLNLPLVGTWLLVLPGLGCEGALLCSGVMTCHGRRHRMLSDSLENKNRERDLYILCFKAENIPAFVWKVWRELELWILSSWWHLQACRPSLPRTLLSQRWKLIWEARGNTEMIQAAEEVRRGRYVSAFLDDNPLTLHRGKL